MHYTHLRVVSIPVADQDRARDFYVRVLGFELRREASFGDGQQWLEVAPPGAQTALTLVTWFPSMPAGSLQGLAIGVRVVDAASAEHSEGGWACEGPPQDAPWGRFATFRDPDGNGLILTPGEG